MTQKQTTHLDILIATLREFGDKGATLVEIAVKSELEYDEIMAAYMAAEESRIDQDKSGAKARFRLSPYERDGLHPNAGEVMAWLDDRPLPRTYVEEDRDEMKAALKQLVQRRLVKTTCAGTMCYRADRPEHAPRARKLAKACKVIGEIYNALPDEDQRTVMQEVFDFI